MGFLALVNNGRGDESAAEPETPVVADEWSEQAAAPIVKSDTGTAPQWPSTPPLAMPSGLEALMPTPTTDSSVTPSLTLPTSTPWSGHVQDTLSISLEEKPAPPEPKDDSSTASSSAAPGGSDPNATSSSTKTPDATEAPSAKANGTNGGINGGTNGAAARQADAQLVARGRSAFERSCTDCHDAERSTQKRKSRSAWLGTIRRMASMDGADIPSSDFNAIAAYLASLHSPVGAATNSATADAGGASSAAGDSAMSTAAIDEGPLSSLSLGGTVSTLWRGGNDNLESPDFFPDVWLTAAWQPSGPLSGRVTACTSCHSDRSGGTGFTFELVEASASFDLLHSHKERRREADCDPRCELGAEIKAGRLVVPFGAFASMSHPGVYRTITNPLIYNMGRQVNAAQNRPPVLPMPYSDEGADLSLRVPILGSVYATADLYAVNGLQGFGPGMQFSPSRSYTDNNGEPAIGGRATVGTSDLRVGGSVMSGRMQEEGATPLGYKLTGADATWRYRDLLRTYFEYAIRANDNDISELQQMIYGIVAEGEVLLWSEPDIHFLLRYDTLEYRDRLGEDSTDRITWGFNTTLPGGSLLILNHERWRFHTESPDVDVVGLRWVVTF